jgi:NAD(P)-dependent dehydrogenase (short-subunit alcohol dehydrogenase family)
MNDKLSNLFDLNGKVIVVTGAAGLLGRKHAEAIAAFGGTPILVDLTFNNVQSYADELNERFNTNAIGVKVDITDEKQIIGNVQHLISKYGKIDGLVNNAANNPKIEHKDGKNFSRLENFSLEIWNEDIAVGLTGAFLCSKHYGSMIAENPEGGSIVNISSDLGLISPDQRLYYNSKLSESQQAVKPITYSIVKTGVIGLTRYLASYWAEKNVRCNAICPGGVENGQPNNFIKNVSLRIPMNRMARVDEYQSTLIWMLSDASSYLNGAIVPVDGGRTMW